MKRTRKIPFRFIATIRPTDHMQTRWPVTTMCYGQKSVRKRSEEIQPRRTETPDSIDAEVAKMIKNQLLTLQRSEMQTYS